MRWSHIKKCDAFTRQLLYIQSRLIHRYLYQSRVIALEEEGSSLVARIFCGDQGPLLDEKAGCQIQPFLRTSGNDDLIRRHADSTCYPQMVGNNFSQLG